MEALEPSVQKLSDEALRNKTEEFRARYQKGETLDDLLPEAFAVVREAAVRTTGMRHFDVQLIGGVVLHQGRIAEMKTGEGKTLVATLPAYLNALEGKSVHIVTVNDDPAKRDTEWMGKILPLPGLWRWAWWSTASIRTSSRAAYAAVTSPTAPTTSSASTTCGITW